MHTTISKLLVPLALAVTLAACASLPDPQALTRDHLSRLHAGLTQDEVRALAGKPANATRASRTGDSLWIYPFTDDWGYDAELDVEFDAQGVVTATSSERFSR